MTFRNGNAYENNWARAAAYFLSTCAERPADAPRAAAHDFITGIYQAFFTRPGDLGLKPLPDVSFAPWEQQRDREKDVKTIRDSIKKIEAVIAELFRIVVAADARGDSLVLNERCAKPGKTLSNALRAAGAAVAGGEIALPRGCVSGLKELAGVSQQHVVPITDSPQEDKAYLYFSRCVFSPEEPWTAAAFDGLLGADGRLMWLCGELEKRGYARVDCKDGKKISLDYVKRFGRKEGPVKMSWADKTHTGVEVTYEDLRLAPCCVWLRMSGYKDVLERCAAYPAPVVDFLLKHTKNCDGCRYCVQTDKTGTRPLAAVSVGGRKKCPYYPSFSMNWRDLTDDTARAILAVLDAVYPDAEAR